MNPARLYVIDDDDDHRISLVDLMEAAGHHPVTFPTADGALGALRSDTPEMILCDLRMPGLDGLAFLERIADTAPGIPVVILTGHGDVAHAVSAMRLGAEDFLEKPYQAEHLLAVVQRTLRTRRISAEVARLQTRLGPRDGFLGESRTIDALRQTLVRIAPLDIDVVISGETGTGKDLAARSLHLQGRRAAGPFEVIDCGRLSETGAEAELFGRSARLHGGQQDVPGRIEAADGGTLVLDRIDTLPGVLQVKLLGVLETRQVQHGAGDPRQLDFRVLATSSVPLRDAVRAGHFREDLYFRLAGYELALPPLRKIPADIPILFAHFVAAAAARHGRDAREITFEDRKALQSYDWPGNAHELRGMADRFALGLEQMRRAASSVVAAPKTLPELVEAYETQEIARAMDRCQGNTAAAARLLGIPRRTLNAKISRKRASEEKL